MSHEMMPTAVVSVVVVFCFFLCCFAFQTLTHASRVRRVFDCETKGRKGKQESKRLTCSKEIAHHLVDGNALYSQTCGHDEDNKRIILTVLLLLLLMMEDDV